jgi:hypothetical protein
MLYEELVVLVANGGWNGEKNLCMSTTGADALVVLVANGVWNWEKNR